MTKTRFLPAFLFALTNIFNVTGESSNEWAGVIVQIKDKFFYTCPVSSGEFSTFTVRAAFPKSAKLVAIYHSHPGTEYAGEYFSPDDVAVAKQLNLPSYIGVLTSHNIHRYIPSKDSTQTYHNGSHIAKGFTSTGTVI